MSLLSKINIRQAHKPEIAIGCSLRNYLGSGTLLVKRVRQVASASTRVELCRVENAQLEQIEAGVSLSELFGFWQAFGDEPVTGVDIDA